MPMKEGETKPIKSQSPLVNILPYLVNNLALNTC
jgi:hypothetical protein